MNYTMKEQFDCQQLNDLNIVEVVHRLGITTRRAGVNDMIPCPWHDDQHPSLTLYNRQNNQHCHCYACGAHGSVIDLVMKLEGWTFLDACRWLSQEFGIGKVKAGMYIPRPKIQSNQMDEKPKYSFIPMEMVDKMVSEENSLCRCLMHMFHPEAVKWMTEEYRIGCCPLYGQDDYTVFPSIDINGQVLNLKVQLYDANPGSPLFGHSIKGHSYWLGKIWVDKGLLPKETKYRCDGLFGAHLLNHYTQTPVVLVESPKNAVFGALAFPDMVWVAAGNKSNLKRNVLEPLRGRDVIVIPDCDAINEWTEIINGMADLANFTISDFCQRHAPENQPKFDIADYLQQQRLGDS